MFNPFKKSAPAPIETVGSPDLARAFNDFGFRLFEEICRENSGQTVVISPFGIAGALTMVLAGAQRDTKAAMARALNLLEWDASEIYRQFKKLIHSFLVAGPDIQITAANSLWIKNGCPIHPDYKRILEEYFQALVSSLDVDAPQAAQTINRWVENATGGKIASVISPPLNPLPGFFLINATYFKGLWEQPFYAENTEKRLFFREDQTEIKCWMMPKSGTFQYFEMDGLQAVTLPYGKNNRFDMCIFLPRNMVAFLTRLRPEEWRQWTKKLAPREGTVLLPKFKLDYAKDLVPPLKKLGLETVFSEAADLSEISTEPLFVNQVLHKLFIDVNEKGTEAAATTELLMVMSATFPRQRKRFYMEINRPFFFVIRDNLDGKILFMSLVEEPTGY